MTPNRYDVIVVGARCAGSPAAMLLARKGYRVLLVDRDTFPSDTISTHIVHSPGMAALERWGLRERLMASGCPPIDTYFFDFGAFTISGNPTRDGEPGASGPRRTVLDKLLLDAALEAGVEVREGFSVKEVLVEDGVVTGIRGHAAGKDLTEGARVIIGADGLHSLVAQAVRPAQYNEKPQLLCGYYAYWSGLPTGGRVENYVRPHRGFAVWETNDGLTVVIAGWPYREFDAVRKDIEGNYLKSMEMVPSFAERLRAARRESRFQGMAVPNYFRVPYGPGWALVGDAGYNKDFITGYGITDAFLDAELCATALDEAFSGARHYNVAMSDYQSKRDERAIPRYEFTTQLATLEPPRPEMQSLLAAISRDQQSMDGFARVAASIDSEAEFFAPENVQRIFARAQQPSSAATAS